MFDKHAIVIGGSIAGLLAARVLADHFTRVTILERDRLPHGPEARKGLPQACHVHVLLWRGQTLLEQLFPGLQTELDQAGAPQVDWIGDAMGYSFGGWMPHFPSSYLAHPCSRDLLEWLIRRRLSAYPQVHFLEERQAIGLISNGDRQNDPGSGPLVAGVRLRSRARPAQDEEDLAGDLIVDASGRDSRAPVWLAALGCPSPHETVVNSFLGYASRVYRKPPDIYPWKSLLVRGTPPGNKRGGVINPIENDRWMVTLAGAGRDYPPIDEAGFLDFARSLPAPILYQAIQSAEALTPITGYRKTENRWRHYERLTRQPGNFVLLGDAVCAFNPVYGQGMTLATLGATLLADCLSRRGTWQGLTGLAQDFQKKLARVLAAPWLLATGDDFRYLETQGEGRGMLTPVVHRYIDRAMAIANHDQRVFTTYFEVAQLLAPVVSFFSPSILAKVFYHALFPYTNVKSPEP
jgi:2-polyprenyl-6-methoxyphenol hydroxylase-like FAD-dependent oxidoreductase